MSVERDIRFELLARLCPNSTGADLRSVCTEAGMFAVRQRRKVCSTTTTTIIIIVFFLLLNLALTLGEPSLLPVV
jgi:SpoVK/Ycf46/Vps4 family AAA+-type ATPase